MLPTTFIYRVPVKVSGMLFILFKDFLFDFFNTVAHIFIYFPPQSRFGNQKTAPAMGGGFILDKLQGCT